MATASKKDVKEKQETGKHEKDKKEKIPVVVPSAEFDLNTYAGRYEGHTKVRLYTTVH